MNITYVTRLGSIFMLLGVLSACGFQLRGQLPQLDSLSSPWQVQGVPRYSTLYQEVQRQLSQAGITLVTEDGQKVLLISEQRNTSRLFSVDANNEIVENELTASFRFALRILDQDKPVEPTLIRTTRILYQPQAERLSSDREAIRLQKAMQRELVTRMVRLLAAQANNTASKNQRITH